MNTEVNFSQLPTEMIRHILFHFPTKDRLSLRLVNRRLMEISSSICRQLFVGLKRPIENTMEPILTTFSASNMDHLPWSACTLDVDCYSRTNYRKKFMTLYRTHFNRFVKLFGPYIKVVVIQAHNWQSAVTVLKSLPNVQSLEVQVILAYQSQKKINHNLNFPPSTDFNFSKMENITMVIWHPNSVKFLDFVVENSKLKHINLRYAGRNLVETIQVAKILSKVPSIFLEMDDHSYPLQEMDVLTSTNLKIQELKLGGSPHKTAVHYTQMEKFLSSISATLQKFTIFEVYMRDQGSVEQLQIPKLPALQHLEFELDVIRGTLDNSKNVEYLFLDALVPKNFPNLKKVSINCYHPTIPAFQNKIFESVMVLKVFKNHNHIEKMEQKWGHIFPNLKKLETRVNCEGLLHIVSEMQNLEALLVEICKDNEENQRAATPLDVNVVLTGYSNPDAVYEKSKDDKRSQTSILSLRKLNMLELNFTAGNSDPWQLRNSGAMLALLPLPPLERLTLKHVNISEECIQILTAHHGRVVVEKFMD